MEIKFPVDRWADSGQLLPLYCRLTLILVPLISPFMLFDRPRTHPGQTDYKFPSAAAEGARDTLSGVAEGQRACESPINISLALARRLSLLPTSRLHAACARVRVFCMYYPGSAPKNPAPPSVLRSRPSSAVSENF